MLHKDIQSFAFPTWEAFRLANQPFLDGRQYKGYSIQIPVTERGLYLLIDCQNDSFVTQGDNVIRFAWCNRGGFAIASARYVNNEAGYLAGCAFLIDTAMELRSFFEMFATTHAPKIRKRIEAYTKDPSKT